MLYNCISRSGEIMFQRGVSYGYALLEATERNMRAFFSNVECPLWTVVTDGLDHVVMDKIYYSKMSDGRVLSGGDVYRDFKTLYKKEGCTRKYIEVELPPEQKIND